MKPNYLVILLPIQYSDQSSLSHTFKVMRIRPIVDQCITQYVHIYQSTNSRPIIDQYIDQLSADMCTFIGWLSADISVHCQPICRPRPLIVNMIPVNCLIKENCCVVVLLWWRAHTQIISFRNSLGWSIYIIKSVDETKLSCYTSTYSVSQFP